MNLAKLKGQKVSYQIARRKCKCSKAQDEIDDILDDIEEDIMIEEMAVGVGTRVLRLDKYAESVQHGRSAAIAAERERRGEMFERDIMNKQQERKQCKVIGWLIFIVSIALLAVIASSGCRTVKGAADGFMLDGQAMFNYAVDHKDSSTQNQ